ncbi:MAG TPA: lipase secretion chaperone [Noviherbaspirillum sp.]|nr:lipase secretion chaperone [Noviherbaspirillum sp.]
MRRPIAPLAAATAMAAVAYLLYPPSNEGALPGGAQEPQIVTLFDPLLARPVVTEHAPPSSPQTPQTPMFDLSEDGRLLPGPHTAEELDVLLAQLPENPDQTALQRLESRITEGLPVEAKTSAVHILHAYLRYRKAEAEFESRRENTEGMTAEERFRNLVALRRQHLGPEVASALFSASEVQAWHGIQVLRIEADGTLDTRQKNARLAALENALPDAVVDMMGDDADTRAVRATEREVASLRERGASEEEIKQFRTQALDEDALQAISAMEAQQVEWARRYESFRQQAAPIHAAGISEPLKQQHVDALLRQHYKEHEVQAARAYDQAAGQR